MKNEFGEDCEIYAFGYSLGSTSLLRHLGENQDGAGGIKAAAAISAPFDLSSTGIEL